MTQPSLFDVLPTLPAPTRRAPRAKVAQPVAAAIVVAEPQSWTITLPAPDRMMSVNTAKHWRVTSPVKAAWRKAMFDAAGKAKLPTGLTRVRIDIELRFPTRGDRDASNYHHYVGKPLVDGLGRGRLYQVLKGKRAGTWVNEPGYELIPDDNPRKHLHCEDCPHLRVAHDDRGPRPYGEVVITITDLSEVRDGH
jgi:hypothetical protein